MRGIVTALGVRVNQAVKKVIGIVCGSINSTGKLAKMV